MRLQEKVAIVTGGGGGMGVGICDSLIGAGADIFVADLNLEAANRTVERIEQKGRRGIAFQSDVTSEGDCQSLVEEAIRLFGQVDILVNNAGHFGERLGLPFMNQTETEWDENYAVNVKGPFFLCKAVAPHMIERRFGKIINISSIAAKRDPQILPAYGAAKNAVLSLTRVVAKDLGPHSINVNAVCPGMMWTPFWHKLAPLVAAGDPSFADLDARGVFDRFVSSSTPLKREQTPEDVGNLVAFLASEEARNITGQAIHVDGGVAMG